VTGVACLFLLVDQWTTNQSMLQFVMPTSGVTNRVVVRVVGSQTCSCTGGIPSADARDSSRALFSTSWMWALAMPAYNFAAVLFCHCLEATSLTELY